MSATKLIVPVGAIDVRCEFLIPCSLISFFTDFGTPYAFIALLPVLLVWKAFKMADEWMVKWNNPDADIRDPADIPVCSVECGAKLASGLYLMERDVDGDTGA